MKSIHIPIHSFVDIITNSSTVIYVSTRYKTKEMLIEFVNSLLKSLGSDKKFDDFFEYDEQVVYPDKEYEIENIIQELKEKKPKTKIEKLQKEAEEIFMKRINGENTESSEYGYYSYTEVLLRCKNTSEEVINISESIKNIFSLQEHDT